MPLIFAVDTTTEHGSLALLRNQDLLEEASIHAPTGFSHLLYAEIAALFARHALHLADVDCFASASGPGAFTGVRVSLACIKGLAEALARPALAAQIARIAAERLAQGRATDPAALDANYVRRADAELSWKE
jgi:tRNA threonylcarbamoyladenosine biosynthesis protein TsaB